MQEQPNGEEASTESTPKPVFILRDFSHAEIEEVLDQARLLPEFNVVVPGLGTEDDQGRVFEDVVRKRIQEAERVVAYLDLANANVAFEIGFALGKGARLLLARNRETMPSLSNVAPFSGTKISHAEDVDGLSALFASDKASPPIEKPESGEETLLLCPPKGGGIGYRRYAREELGWRTLEPEGWSLSDLPGVLRSVDTAVWILPMLPDSEGDRDHPLTCAAATVAGCADAWGIDLKIFRSHHHRKIEDVADRERTFESVEQLYSWLDEIDSAGCATAPTALPIDKIAAYRKALGHRHRRLVPFFPGVSERVLSEVYVELEITTNAWEKKKETETRGAKGTRSIEDRLERTGFPSSKRLSLRELLDLDPGEDTGSDGRWMVLGEPGAGKSTACRHLCSELSREADGPIPIFLSLVRWQKEKLHPFKIAEIDTEKCSSCPGGVPGLADQLGIEATQPNRVWLLLDGLDEVKEGERAEVLNNLDGLLGEFPNCRIVVTSRAAGHEKLGGFHRAEIQPLGPEERKKLLSKWLQDRGAVVWDRLQEIPTLAELGRNPLLLTLIAKLWETEQSLPRTRIELYQKALDLLLRRGHGEVEQGMRSALSAKALLPPLSLQLHKNGGESWTMEELDEAIDQVLEKDPKLEKKITRVWASNDEFLEDLGFNSGILAPRGGREEPWSYMHRSFREYLAAQALVELGEAHYLELASEMRGRKEAISRWNETFALLCGLVEGAGAGLRLLTQIREAEAGLALRSLPHVEDLSPTEALKFLVETRGWDGEDLQRLITGWRARGSFLEEIEQLLIAQVNPELRTEVLAYLYYGLETAGIEVDREVFFRACNRWPKGGPKIPKVVPIPPPGKSCSFLIGSPESVGNDDERPQRRVTLSAFRMAKTAVTEEEFARFDRSRQASRKKLPVVEVSWWEAWLYCRWIGGFLPTEAQWEFACRAGSDRQWWTGDEEAELERAAWYGEGYKGQPPHPVGEKQANPWSLYDVHGNVWEWCADWYSSYPESPQTDPSGPQSGSDRVIRGGSCWNGADGCRSAFRFRIHPGSRRSNVGFRVALPASPSS